MESKKINQLATELAPDLSDLTIIGDPTTGISKKITLSQMASLFTGTVEEYANFAAFPLVGVADTIYIAKDTNVIYRWDSTAYVVLSPNIIASLVFNDANGFDGTIALVGSVATLTITTALTSGSVPFIGASGALTQDNANLFFDDTNNRLGINTNAPTTALDVFGSGIIGRINATSTNNAYLGFSSAGTNKWSVGNVQSDHRFRIFSEANSAELITILQTGEFGIGIANPTTKFHIDGAASALIANLDANVSIAKSVSFRSDNSARINLEVSGTESGSNVGADFFLRTFTDAGSLLETPFTIVRSTGVTTIKSLTLTNVLSVANGGTGSATQNFVDLTTTQSIGGAKTFTSALAGTSATFSSSITAGAFIKSSVTSGGSVITAQSTATSGEAQIELLGKNSSGTIRSGTFKYDNSDVLRLGTSSNIALRFETNDIVRLTIAAAGAATFSSSVSASGTISANGGASADINNVAIRVPNTKFQSFYNAADTGWAFSLGTNTSNDGLLIANNHMTFSSGTSATERMRITSGGFTKMSNNGSYLDTGAGIWHEIRQSNNNRTVVISNSSASFTNTVMVLGSATSASASYNFIAADDGAVGQFRVSGNGVIYAQNTSVQSISDIRTKENIINSNEGLDVITALRPVRFDFKEGFGNNRKNQLGFIAQEVEEIFPDAVGIWGESDEENNPYKSLGTASLIPVLVKAIQELKAEIEELKAKIK